MKYASLGMTFVTMGLAVPAFFNTIPRLDPAVELQEQWQAQEPQIQRLIQAPSPAVCCVAVNIGSRDSSRTDPG